MRFFKFRLVLIIFLCLIAGNYAYSENSPIKILSWWHYFEPEWIKQEIKKQCNVELATQYYKDSYEFTKVFDMQNFDIVIYESTLLENLKPFLNANNIQSLEKLNYPKEIQNIYNNYINNPNTAYFYLADIVFLYNPNFLNITTEDTIETIRNNLNQNITKPFFVILDDPVIINQLINIEAQKKLSTESFSEVLAYSNLILSNDFIDYKNLGVFITWSGAAIHNQEMAKKQNINLKISSIPKYSFITADLISLISKKQNAICVYDILKSQKFLETLQNTTYYYSPYLTKNVQKTSFIELEENFEKHLHEHNLKWISPSKNELAATLQSWEQLILDYGL